jgi:hypothetical protein
MQRSLVWHWRFGTGYRSNLQGLIFLDSFTLKIGLICIRKTLVSNQTTLRNTREESSIQHWVRLCNLLELELTLDSIRVYTPSFDARSLLILLTHHMYDFYVILTIRSISIVQMFYVMTHYVLGEVAAEFLIVIQMDWHWIINSVRHNNFIICNNACYMFLSYFDHLQALIYII